MTYRSKTGDSALYVFLAGPDLQLVVGAMEVAIKVAVVVMAAAIVAASVMVEVGNAEEMKKLPRRVRPCLHQSGSIAYGM
jgi:hypothetical protein